MQDDKQIQKAVTDLVSADISTFALSLDDESELSDVRISDPPKTASTRGVEPTRRNTYFTKRPLFRMTAIVSDESVLAPLTAKMLGPGAEFTDVHVLASPKADPRTRFRIVVNITDSVHMSDSTVRLGMVAVDVLEEDTKRKIDHASIYALINLHHIKSRS